MHERSSAFGAHGDSGALGSLFETGRSHQRAAGQGGFRPAAGHSGRNPICVVCLLIGANLAVFNEQSCPTPAGCWADACSSSGLCCSPPDYHGQRNLGGGFRDQEGGFHSGGVDQRLRLDVERLSAARSPGLLHQRWGWSGVFRRAGGASLLVSGLLLAPKWNAVPATSGCWAAANRRSQDTPTDSER